MKSSYKIIFLLFPFLIGMQSLSWAQTCSIFAGNDTSFCLAPDSLQLNAQPSSPLDSCGMVEWSPSTGLSNPNILNPVAIINSSITYSVTAYIPTGANLVVNGDFESGNTGFTNGYSYNCPFGGILSEGEYCVTTNPHNVHTGATSCTDHTSGSGKMLVVNGSTVSNSNVWEETIAVNPATYYLFSFWVINWSSFTDYLPTFDIDANNVSQNLSLSINSTQCLWKPECLMWYSDTSNSAKFQIIDQVNYYGGNDFAFDDISLQEVCVATDSLSIHVGGLISANHDTTVCRGSTVTMMASNGYSYSWTPSGGLSCNTCQSVYFVADSSVLYYAHVTGNGCDMIDTFMTSVDTLPTLILPDDTFTCQGNPFQIYGQSSSTIVWSPPAFLSCDTCNSPIATPPATTSYVASATNGVCIVLDSFTLHVSQVPLIALPPDTNICNGSELILSIDSGYSSYYWSPGIGLSCTNCSSTIASPDSNIAYFVSVSDSGCNSTDSIFIIVSYNDPVTTGKNDSICLGSSVQLEATGASIYQWSPSSSLNNDSINNPVAEPISTTEYYVHGSDACGVTVDSVTVFVFDPPIVEADYDSIIYCHSGTQITLTGQETYSYQWLNPDISNDTSSSVFVNPDNDAIYQVNVSNAICDTSLQFPVMVSNAQIAIPTAFSPNNDGINDFFYILRSCPLTLNYLRVFNRWGELIFETNDIHGKWDGTFKNKNCPIDVYVYVVSATQTNGENYQLKGNVTLVR